MVVGDLRPWLARFRDVDTRFLARIHDLWERCLQGLPSQPEEDDITASLVHRLNQDPEVRKIGYPDFQYVPFEVRPAGGISQKGFIDMALILDQDRECYLAYECKRLNVRYDGSRGSLAGRYVKEGMMRYVTEQYAQNLPVGCMLGYVMDGDMAFARKQVSEAIATRKADLRLLNGPIVVAAITFIERFMTNHRRSDRASPIEIRHAFLPLPAGGAS